MLGPVVRNRTDRWSVDAMSSWEHRLDIASVVLPYVLLTASVLASLAQPGQTGEHRLGTLGLTALAALWVLGFHTLRPATRQGRGLITVTYIAGLLVLSALLMHRDPLFFIFTVTAFVHSAVLQPTPLAFLAVGVTSVLINTLPYQNSDPTSVELVSWVAVIIVQTVLIGSTNMLGRKLTEQNEQRRQTVLKLEAALAENARLHARLVVQAREAGMLDERQRMAQEIHDTLAQGLTGIITQLEAAERTRATSEAWRRHLAAARSLARQSLTEARRSVQALHPEPLDTEHLPDALESMARRWSQSCGVSAEFRITGEPRRMVPDVEAALFRVAQEALTNVGKHAAASRVGVTLSYTDEVVLLDVRDNGIGFDSHARVPSRDGTGFGLDVMRRRLQRVAGNLEIESVPGDGTAIGATVPALAADVLSAAETAETAEVLEASEVAL